MKVKLTTSMGAVTVELNKEKAPISTENFVKYVEAGHYNGTIFHRVIDGFMVQGGGFTKDMQQKPVQAPIKNEAANGLKNDMYTLAMARTGVRDSATAQFFINVKAERLPQLPRRVAAGLGLRRLRQGRRGPGRRRQDPQGRDRQRRHAPERAARAGRHREGRVPLSAPAR